MLNFIKCLSVFLILFSNVVNSQPAWQFIDAPEQSRFRSLSAIDGNVFLVGSKVLKLSGENFSLFGKEVSVKIDRSFILSSSKIWVSNLTDSSESQLFYYNGTKWNEISNPLVNNITFLYFTDVKNGYLAGLAEFVKVSHGQVEFLPSPTTATIEEIIPLTNNKVYIRTISG
jgi:hypothetical protein